MPTPVEQLRKQCADYKAHLEADIRQLAEKYLPETDLEKYRDRNNRINIQALIDKRHEGRTLTTPKHSADITHDNPVLVSTIQKLEVVNKMLGALNNTSSKIEDKKRIKNMASILTHQNQTLLSTHRSMGPGSDFLQAIFHIIFSTLNLDVRPKTTGQILAEKIQEVERSMEKPTPVERPATGVPRDGRPAEADLDDIDVPDLFSLPIPTLVEDPDEVVIDLGKNDDSTSGPKGPG